MSDKDTLRLRVDNSIELRLHTIEDAETEWNMLSENLDFLGKWVDWAQPTYTFKDVQRDMSGNLPAFQEGKMYAMGIYVDDVLAGNVDIRDIVDDKTAEVGYLLSENFTGKGIVTKSMQTLMDYVQKHHNIQTFHLNTYVDNEASKRVAARLGFKLASTSAADNGRPEAHFVKEISKD